MSEGRKAAARARRGILVAMLLALAIGLAVLAGLEVARGGATPAAVARGLADWQLRLLAPDDPPAGVLVVDIDQTAIEALRGRFGPWPFGRDAYALVVEGLRDLGARAVVIDLLLADARDGDAALAQAIARPGAPVILAAAGVGQPAAAGASLANGPQWPGLVRPSATLWPAPDRSPPVGLITSPLDADGVLRRLPLVHLADGERWPLLPLAVLQVVAPDTALAARQAAAPFVAFGASPETVAFDRLADAAQRGDGLAALRPRVEGRVVFIGSGATLGDRVMTTAGQLSGTVVLATTYAALRDGRSVGLAGPALGVALVLLAVVPLVLAWRRGGVRPVVDLAAALGVAVLVATVIVAAVQGGRLVPWLSPLAALLAGVVALLVLYHLALQAERRRVDQERAVAEAAHEAKSRFLAHVSHEIRTPVNAVLGVAEVLAATPLDAEQRRHVQVLRDAGETLHGLIADLLDLSRIEAGRLELDIAPFALAAAIGRVTNLLGPRASSQGLPLEVEMAPGLPAVVAGDRLRLEQALLNLLGNAIKFTERGRVWLRVTPAPGGRVRFVVGDTGLGIAPSKLGLIFEPFEQADRSVTRRFGGTGLGLSITRSLVRLMGGDIDVHSTPGQGSEFSFEIPLPPASLPASPPVGAPAAPEPVPARAVAAAGAAPTRLLLAEDNEVNAYVFRSMLQGYGVEIELASNGPAALALLTLRRYALAFIDVQMPGLDGLSVTRELRRLEAATGRPRTPVVALTANAYPADIVASREAGCDRHLAKPFTRAQLLEAIAELAVTEDDDATPGTASAAPVPSPVDHASALARLGGNSDLHRGVAAHARVFLQGWAETFDAAAGAASGADRAHRLVHDLKSVAAAVGAHALADAAMQLEKSMREGPPTPAALAAVRALLPPVIAALSAVDPA